MGFSLKTTCLIESTIMFLCECPNRITWSSTVICSERCCIFWCHSDRCRPTLYTLIVLEAFETSPSCTHLNYLLMVVVRSISCKNKCSYWDDTHTLLNRYWTTYLQPCAP